MPHCLTIPCIDAKRIEVHKGLRKVDDGMEFLHLRKVVQGRGTMTGLVAKRSETPSKARSGCASDNVAQTSIFRP